MWSVYLLVSILVSLLDCQAIIDDPSMVPIESYDQKLKQQIYITNKYDNNAFPSD